MRIENILARLPAPASFRSWNDPDPDFRREACNVDRIVTQHGPCQAIGRCVISPCTVAFGSVYLDIQGVDSFIVGTPELAREVARAMR